MFKVKVIVHILQSVQFSKWVEILLLRENIALQLMTLDCVKFRLLEKYHEQSQDKQSVAVFVALCQLGISNGRFQYSTAAWSCHSLLSFIKHSFQFFAQRAISCNSAFSDFVQLRLSGKKYFV